MYPLFSRIGMSALLTARALWSPVVLGVSAIAQDKGGHVLLVRHTYKPGWALPGGGVDRGEPPLEAVLRELREEVGLLRSVPPEFFALYTRKSVWATNVVAVYRLRDVEIAFKRSLEIREARFFNPRHLPDDTLPGTVRRIAEALAGKTPDFYW